MKKIFAKILVLLFVLTFVASCAKKVPEPKVEQTAEKTETTKSVEEKTTLNPDITIKIDNKKDTKTGYDIVEFGNYDKEIGFSNPIEWLIIDKNDQSYLLLSRYVLDCANYNDKQENATWENATLKDWLNDYFMHRAFNEDEIKYLSSVNTFGLDGAVRVGMLNIAACEKYFGEEASDKTNYKLSAKATNFAISEGVEVVEAKNSDYYLCSSYYLTDNGKTKDKAAWVGQMGRIYRDGQNVKLKTGDGVRPVIAVKKALFADDVKVITNTIDGKLIDSEGNAVYSNTNSVKYQSGSVPLDAENVVNLKKWEYGKSPIEWIFVAPGHQIICNNSPNRSEKFSYKMKASSGVKGCYIPIFSRCECYGDDWEGRFYSFDDYSKKSPEEFDYKQKFEDLYYGDYNIKSLLSKKYDLTEVAKGVVKANGDYVNVIYVSELEEIISKLE